MILYRVEHREEARGPYTGLYAIREMEFAHDDYLHPAVDEDCEEVFQYANVHSDYIHGMPTKESLLEWFKGFLLILHHNDFVLKTFEVESPHFAVGVQAIFDPKRAKVVHTEELIDYHDMEQK